MHPNGTKLTKTWVWGPMEWIGCIGCEKFQCNFVAQTFALVRSVLHWVSYGNQTVPNAPKWYEMQQNESLGSNGVDRVCSSRKTSTQLRRTNFYTSSERIAPSLVRQPNSLKCTQMVQNSPKHEFRVQWGGLGAFVAKNSNATLWNKLLHLFGPFCTEICKATKWFQMHLIGTKLTKTWV